MTNQPLSHKTKQFDNYFGVEYLVFKNSYFSDFIWFDLKKKFGSNCVVKDFPLKSSKNQFWNFSQVLIIISGSLFINFFLEFIAIS